VIVAHGWAFWPPSVEVVTIVLVLATVVAYYLQWQVMRANSRATALFEIAKQTQSGEQRGARKTLYRLAALKAPLDVWRPEDREASDVVVQLMNSAAYFESRGMFPKGALEGNWGEVFHRVLVASREQVAFRRVAQPDLWKPFTDFAERISRGKPDPVFVHHSRSGTVSTSER
jgi:hypothetical protein